jgi:hypothetical protein
MALIFDREEVFEEASRMVNTDQLKNCIKLDFP